MNDRRTPGVYVTEVAAFPSSIVGVATALPIFVGYTRTAVDPSSGKPLYLKAICLSSMADYENYFGTGYDAKGVVARADNTDDDFQANSLTVSGTGLASSGNTYVVSTVQPQSAFNLYAAMQLFFANGGGDCFVVSVANYWGTQSSDPTPSANAALVTPKDLLAGLEVAASTRGPTMIVVPDACLLTQQDATTGAYVDYQPVACAMLNQAAALQDRVAILDMPGALDPAYWNGTAMVNQQAPLFYQAIASASDNFSYGAAYGPALESSVLSSADIRYNNLWGAGSGVTDPNAGASSIALMNNLLTSQAYTLYPSAGGDYSDKFQQVAARIAVAFPISGAAAFGDPGGVTGATSDNLLVSLPNPTYFKPTDADTASGKTALDQYLTDTVPLLEQIEQILANKLNVVPPSSAIAGVWSNNDAQRGVWNAPANYSLSQIVTPKVALTDEEQGTLNVPLNGNAINLIRSMVNRGTVVWGARTLDGNSLDYRYLQVRRTLIYIEQSIKTALQQYVFAANDAGTWATVTATISNFLTQLWQAGGLMGDKPSDAFTVQCGLPVTMTSLDVLNGIMIVNVTVQLIHPAEFIELTFQQTMQGS